MLASKRQRAAARCGSSVALVTMMPEQVGAMSCNPSIGGVGKGHIVREIDALDGVMARAADRAAIHHRMLNRSKGAAVHGPRAQADRCRYANAVKAIVREHSTIAVVRGEAFELTVRQGRVRGVNLSDGSFLPAKSVVLASGTFLGGRLFCGLERGEGGRRDERAALPLARQLRELGLGVGRLKTGTPPRLDGRTIDWSRLEPQPSDIDTWTMSSMTDDRLLPQVGCAITRTTSATHEIVRGALVRSPLHDGAIEGRGPRYCPSIEDKVARFR